MEDKAHARTGRLGGTGRRRTRLWPLAQLSFLVALTSLGLCLGFGVNTRQFIAHAQGTEAEVVAVQRRAQDAPAQPILRLRTGTEQDILFAPHRTGPDAPWRIGDRITVLYDPAQPWRVAPADAATLWQMPFAFAGTAWVFGLLGFAFHRASRRAA